MEKYTLIGYPLGHSMSPYIHNRLFELACRDAEYNCTEIAPDDLTQKIGEINRLNCYNITIPHKVSVIPYIDMLDISAKRYGAVNCVHNTGSELVGYNTDCDGFLNAVRDFPLSENVLLLGCGGAGRMMAIEAALHGASLTIAVQPRTEAKARALVDEIEVISPNTRAHLVRIDNIVGRYDMLINATPVGMYPHVKKCPVSDDVIANCTTVYDAVYNPICTALLAKAFGMGKKAAGGMSMLVHQAVRAHEIWNGDFYSPILVNVLIQEAEKNMQVLSR